MGNLNNLPSDIILDILTRLPTESILECKLVCKPWRTLVSYHPSFFRLHLKHLNDSSDSGNLSYFVRDYDDKLHYLEYSENHDVNSTRTRRINLSLPFEEPCIILIGSFKGLVCIYLWKFSYFICNPVTREYVMLPKNKRECDDQYENCSRGFGYLPLTNEFKVVALYKLKGKHNTIVEVEIYTLGSGSGWRNVGRFDAKFGRICEDYGVFVNGALHWVDDTEERLFVFDLAEEKFGEPISLPLLPQDSDSSLWIMDGVVYLGVVYYCETTERVLTDIWLLKEKNDDPDMKEQVIHKTLSWNKEFSLPGNTEPLAFTKIGGVLCFVDDTLSIYDPIASTSKDLVDIISLYEMMSYKNSLVSLKELGEEDVKLMSQLKLRRQKKMRFLDMLFNWHGSNFTKTVLENA